MSDTEGKHISVEEVVNEYSFRLVRTTDEGEEVIDMPFREAANMIARIAASMVTAQFNNAPEPLIVKPH